MTKKKILSILIGVVFGAVLLMPAAASGTQEEAQPEEFIVGFMSSLSGPFAAVAETQKMGTELAVKQVNDRGGLDMPWGKVPVKILYKDDEAKLDVGVRRFRELVDAGADALAGTIWNPLAAAINEETKTYPIPYIAACVPAMDSFKKGNPTVATYSVSFTPWSIGYLAGASIVNELGGKTIYYVSRTDSWGSTIYEGLEAALKEYGGEVIGFAEYAKGNVDFSTAINEAKSLKPDVFLFCQFGGDAIAVIKQAADMGLMEMTIPFNAWITNVVGKGIPPKYLEKVYGLSYYYYDMEGFKDAELVKKAEQYTKEHVAMFNEPPDAYGTISYIATMAMLEATEKAGTFDPEKIGEVLATQEFDTVKGKGKFRADHELVGKYLAFIVKGKPASEMKDEWDLFNVKGYFGGESALPPLSMLGY